MAKKRNEKGCHGYKAIDNDIKNGKVITPINNPKLVIMSDCHRGIGNWSDNFLPNRTLFTAALNYYYNNDYTYIELGDGDELWENKDFKSVYSVYKEIYHLFVKFHVSNRLFLVYGNHDRVKENMKYFLASAEISIPFYPAIIYNGPTPIYMIHGHQGDIFNDCFWKLSRFAIRHIWRPLELLGFKDPTGSATVNEQRKASEIRLEGWSSLHDQYLIAGHTHRPTIRASEKYINCGSCVHPEAITAVEVEGSKIELVRWSTCVNDNIGLYVCRDLISEITTQ